MIKPHLEILEIGTDHGNVTCDYVIFAIASPNTSIQIY